jgi:hypothetical protein
MRKIFIVFLLCIFAGVASAQEVYNSTGRQGEAKRKELKPKGFDMSRVVIGGGANLGFGSGYANLGVSPMLGYKITDNFAAGISLSYQFYRNKNEIFGLYSGNTLVGYQQADWKTSVYSGGLWARYLFFRNFFVHVQPEIMNIGVVTGLQQDPATLNVSVTQKRENVFIGLVGAGIRQPITGSLSLYFMLLYDVVRDPNSPYSNSLFDPRFGFNIGF